MKIKNSLFLFTFLVLVFFIPSLQAQNNDADKQAFIQQMAKKYHLSQKYLTYVLNKATYIPQVIPRMQHPFEEKPSDYYQDNLVSAERIKLGVQYWKNHYQALQMVQKEFGVDPSIIVAIIGIETFYGQARGTYQELGALSTLAFHYPPRRRFFRRELEQYILLAKQNHLPIFAMKGSYAGALGIPQFMPSSYRYFGVDFNKDHHIDLSQNHGDAIASIGNYLKKNGWQRNQLIAAELSSIKNVPLIFAVSQGKLKLTVAQLISYGVALPRHLPQQQKVGLFTLHNTHSNEYWLAFPNFRAILAYNTSLNYAVATYKLSLAIEKSYILDKKIKAQNIQNIINLLSLKYKYPYCSLPRACLISRGSSEKVDNLG